jgi:hypothetical protein
MQIVDLDSSWEIPIVNVWLKGRDKRLKRAMLVFDTGSAMTQLDVDLVETLDYSALDATKVRSVKGATGESTEGYVFEMSALKIFNYEFELLPVLTYDFKNFPGIDGLLGWDIIKQLHLTLNGPNNILSIF